MKRHILNIVIIATALLFTSDIWGQTKISGNWNPGTISGSIELTDNVTLTGTVSVTAGQTLQIDGKGFKITTYTGTSSASPSSFNVPDNCTLILKNVTLDGGNTGTIVPEIGEGAVQTYPGFTKNGVAIYATDRANVQLTNVIAQNLCGGAGATGVASGVAFVHLTNSKATTTVSSRGKVTMENCTIQNCLNRNDNGIIYQSGGSSMHGTYIINNTTITHCMVYANDTGTGYGGVIKGPGSTDCSLQMTGSTMSYCWGSAWGGAILWAANLNGCKATFNNCTFEYNYARYLGGAISSEATVELDGCTLQYNKAGYGGGALSAFPFTLTETTGEGINNSTAIGLKLTDNIIQYNETLYSTNKGGANVPNNIRATESGAYQTVHLEQDGYFNPRYTVLNATDVYYPTGGGAIWVLMNKDGWNCNLNIGSNQIYHNSSANNAGGILLFKQTPYRRAEAGEAEYVADKERVKFLGDYSVVNGTRTGVTTMTISANIYSNTAANSGGGIAVGASDNSSATWTFPDVFATGGYIKDNTATNQFGGGLYMPGGNFAVNGNCEISGNTALNNNGGGAYIANGNLTVADNTVLTTHGNEAKNGGGMFLERGNISINGTIIAGISNNATAVNTASGNGGAIYLNTGNLAINKGSIINNNALSGGAIFLGGGTFTINGETTISGNNATSSNGGGIYMSGGSLTVNGNTVMDGNKADSGNGGGVYMADGTLTINASRTLAADGNSARSGGVIYMVKGSMISNGTIKAGVTKANTASENGGAIYLNSGNLTLNDGSFLNNSAKSGGSIYMGGGTFTLNGTATISGNKATAGDGGGMYLGGGTFKVVSAGVINLGTTGASNTATGDGGGLYCAGTFNVEGSALISYNSAANGGGVCVSNGSVSLAAGKGSVINNNTASNMGGGLYVVNTGARKSASFQGGTFTNNTARSGGAVSAVGEIDLTLAATMEGNTASAGNGGAIYMSGGVNMTFGDGLIRANKAQGTLVQSGGTALNKNHENVQGVGGGVFIADNATLKFSNPTEMGIYNNAATNAGADICANGNNTSIELPNITHMSLKGFHVPGNHLYWVEDYFTGESYSTGYNSTSRSGIRYEDALKVPGLDISTYIINYGGSETKKTVAGYTCLDLGYDLVFITLKVIGLLEDSDNVVVTMSYPVTDDNGAVVGSEQYRKVLITGNSSREVGLPSGDWKIETTEWDYKYSEPTLTPSHAADGYIKIKRTGLNGATDENLVITAEFQAKTTTGGGSNVDLSKIKSFEARKVNRMTL